jgi:hypothetical protein
MTSSVVVPIRLVIDSGTRDDPSVRLDEPLAMALEQALERASQDVFSKSSRPIVADEPSYVWTGEGLSRLTENQRAKIEAAIGAVVAQANGRAGILPRGALAGSRSAVPFGEPYDEERDDGDEGYLVDSYTGPDEPRNRELLKKSGGAKTAFPNKVLQPRRSRLLAFPSPWAAARKLHPHIVAGLLEEGATLPFTGLFGVAFQGPKNQDYVCIFRGTISAEKVAATALEYQTLGVTGVELDREGQPVYASGDTMLAASRNAFTIRRVGALVADIDAAISEITRLWLADRSRFREEYLDLAARAWVKRHEGPGTAFQRVRTRAITGAIADLVRHSGLQARAPSHIYEAPDGSLILFGAANVNVARIVVAYSATALESERGASETQPDVERPRPEGEVDAGSFGTVKVVVGRETLEFSLAPFKGELPVSQLDRFGDDLALKMRTIADLLGLPEARYQYAANFTIQAMSVLKARSLYAKFLETGTPAEVVPRSDGNGNFGDADIQPAQSAAVQQLLDLARCAGLIDVLIRIIEANYLHPIRLRGGKQTRAPFDAHDLLAFLRTVVEPHAEMGGRIFADACSVATMQALHAARDTVDAILANEKRQELEFQAVYPAMAGVLRTAGRYEEMLYRLNEAEAAKLALYVGKDTPPWPRTTGEAKTALAALMAQKFADMEVLKDHLSPGEALNWFDDREARSKVVGRPIYLPDGSVVIEDDKRRRWTRDELETAIKVRAGIAGSINPFARHMRNIRGSYAAFTGTEQAAREYFRRMLKAIQAANKSARADVLGKDDYAVETTRSSSVAELQGVHKVAFNLVAKGFTEPELLAKGVTHLFKTMAYSDEGWQYGELGLTIGLGLIYAPLGIVVGLAFTLNRLDTALSHVDLSRGLLNPDEIMRLGDADMELFFSLFEVVLFLATDAKELYSAGKALSVARTEARALGVAARQTKMLTASGVRRILNNLAQELSESIAAKVMVQVTIGLLMPRIMERIMKPLADSLQGTANIDTGFDEALGKLLGMRGEDALASIVAELRAEGVGKAMSGALEASAERGAEGENQNLVPGLNGPVTITPQGGSK